MILIMNIKETVIKNKNVIIRISIIVYAIMLFLLNFIKIFDNNFWGDECFSLNLIEKGFSDIISGTAGDVHPPLYYLYLRVMVDILGSRPEVYHFVSMIPYAVLLIVLLTYIYDKFGSLSAMLMVTLASIQPEAAGFNIEVRMYSMAALFTFIAFIGLYQILLDSTKRRGYLILIVFSLLAAYTHYFAMMGVALFYFALFILVVLKRLKVKQLLITYITTVIGYLPWFFKMVNTFLTTSEGHWQEEYPTIMNGVSYFFTSESRLYTRGMFLLVMGLVAYFVISEIVRYKKSTGKISLGQALSADTLWSICGLGAALGLLLIGEAVCILITPAFLVRYLYPLVPVFWMSLCVCLSRIRWSKVVLAVLIVITIAVYLPSYIESYRSDMQKNTECNETIEFMEEHISSADFIVTDTSHFSWAVFDHYFPDLRVQTIERGYDHWNYDYNFWLLWSEELSDEDMEWLENSGFTVTEMHLHGNIGSYSTNIYKLDEVDSE